MSPHPGLGSPAATEQTQSRLSRRRERRKSEIVNAAIALLATNGYQGMSLDDVAERADIAKPTLYHYFASKDELVSAALEALTTGVLTCLTSVLDATSTASHQERLRALMTEQLRLLTDEFPEVGTIFSWQTSWPAMHDEARKSMRRRHDAVFRDVVSAGVGAGELNCENIDAALQCLHGTINHASIWLSHMRDPHQAERSKVDLLNALMRVFTSSAA